MADSLRFGIGADTTDAENKLAKLWQEYEKGSRSAALEINKILGGTVQKNLEIRVKGGIPEFVSKESLTALDKVVNSLKRAADLQEGSVTSLRQQVNQAKQARDQLAKYGVAADGLLGKIRQINPEWALQNDRVKTLTRELALAGSSNFWDRLKATTNLGGFLSIGNSVTQLVTTFQSLGIIIQQLQAPIQALESSLAGLQAFQLSFKAIGVSADGSNAALQESARIALGLGTNIKTVRDGFQRLSPVVLQSGGTIGDVSNITESLSSRFAAFGLSADASRRVMNGVIQAFAKGKLQAEELTQQISEADPAFKVDFANALGVTVQQLEALVKAGEVTTQVLIDILPQIGKSSLLFGKLGDSASSAVRALGSGSVTIEQVRNQLATVGQLSLENLARVGEPLIKAFLAIQASIVDFLASVSKLEATKSLIGLFGGIGQSIANLLGIVLRLAESFLFAIGPILQLANAVLSSRAGILLLSTAIGVALINAIAGLPAAFTAAIGSIAGVSSAVGVATAKFAALGAASTAASTQVAAASAVMATAARTTAIGTPIASTVALTAATTAATASTVALGTAGAQTGGIMAAAGAKIAMIWATVASSIKSAGLALLGFLKATGPFLAAIGSIALAIDAWNQSTQKAGQIQEDTRKNIEEINDALAEQNGEVKEAGTGWDASVRSVGRFQAGLDRFRASLGLATAEEAQYNQATIAAANASEQRFQALDRLAQAYTKAKAANDGSVESINAEKKAQEALSKSIASRIAAISAEINQEKAKAAVSGAVNAAKNQYIQLLQGEKNALQALQSQYGLLTQQQIDNGTIAKQLATEAKTIAETEINSLRRRKDEVRQRYDAEIERLDQVKSKIQANRQIESDAANERIRQLRALTPAEQRLEDIRRQELVKKARGGDVEAQAQLERLDANREIARIQEEERRKEEAAKKQIAAIEKQTADQKKASKEEQEAIENRILAIQERVTEATELAAKAAGEFTGELQKGETAAAAIEKRFTAISEIASKIRIPALGGNNPPPRFAGGAVSGGSRYTVNELGQEMFLSNAGRLSYIKAPSWGSWTAPSGGTVIPAHVAAGIDIPRAGVQLSSRSGISQNMPTGVSGTNKLLASLVGAVRASMAPRPDSGLAAVVASQAVQLGKLTHAVNELTDKDWNVNVKVRNTGSGAYLDALNRRM